MGRDRANKFSVAMRKHSMAFAEADLNDDGFIDLEEFVSALPRTVREKHTETEIASWFKMLDRDGGGRISRDEHLRWSLNAAALTTGAPIKEVFSRCNVAEPQTLICPMPALTGAPRSRPCGDR